MEEIKSSGEGFEGDPHINQELSSEHLVMEAQEEEKDLRVELEDFQFTMETVQEDFPQGFYRGLQNSTWNKKPQELFDWVV